MKNENGKDSVGDFLFGRWITTFVAVMSLPLARLPCMAAADLAARQAFVVEGIVSYTRVQPNGEAKVGTQSFFSVDVDSCAWRIRMSNGGIPPLDEYPVLYVELSNAQDGIYKRKVWDGGRLRSTQQSAGGARSRTENRVLVTNTLEVYKGVVPFPDGSLAIAPWLAYASTCYFETNQGRIKKLLTMNTSIFENNAVTVPVQTRYSENSTQFPEEIAFLNEGFCYIPKGAGQPVDKKSLLPPFDKGFVETLYQVHAFTTVSNLSVPGRFSISYFAPKSGATSSQDSLLIAKVEGEVQRFSVVPKSLFEDRMSLSRLGPASREEAVSQQVQKPPVGLGTTFQQSYSNTPSLSPPGETCGGRSQGFGICWRRGCSPGTCD